MDLPRSFEQWVPTHLAETAFIPLLLERGLDHIQQGHYAEGAALLTLVCQQLAPEQSQLAQSLTPFLETCTRFQQVQEKLHEMSTCLMQAHEELQLQMTTLQATLPTLVKDIEKLHSGFAAHETNGVSQSVPLRASPQNTGTPYILAAAPAIENTGDAAGFSFLCFGRFEVWHQGRPVPLCSSRSGQHILRYLVARQGHRASTDVLQALLWPEDEAEVAQRKLHIAISALRHSLNDGSSGGTRCIVCKNHVYTLVEHCIHSIDSDEFLLYYRMGQQNAEARIACYEKACQLYSGPFLVEDIYADWSSLQREQLSNAYLTMCQVLADHYLHQKSYEQAAQWATAILAENRCDEWAHRQLIQIFVTQGRRHEAQQQYLRCERILRDELGVQPMPETRQILQKLS